MEIYGRDSLVDAANDRLRNLNLQGLQALDLRTLKPDGSHWDFEKPEDRKLAVHLVQTQKPRWLNGSPPCTSFSRLNVGLNFPRMDPKRVSEIKRQGVMHLHFVISLYRMQLRDGRHVLHEHPAGATSWQDP